MYDVAPARSKDRRPVLLVVAAALALLLSFAIGATQPASAATENVFGSSIPPVKADTDSAAVTLGVKFTAKTAGRVTGLRFYKGAENTGTHVGGLYSATGTRLASKTFTQETSVGWQTVTFTTPIPVAANATLTAAYLAPRGRYAVEQSYPWPKEGSSLTALSGVYRYGSTIGYPTATYQRSNYWVDVTFTAGTSPSPTLSPSPDPSPTVTVTPTPTPTTPAPAGFPGASDTGHAAAPDYPGSLTACVGPVRSGAAYRFCQFPSGVGIGTAASPVANVSFYGVRFASNARADANVAVYGDGIRFDYSTFAPSADTAPPTTYNQGYQYAIDQRSSGQITVDHSDFWGWGNGIQFRSSTQAKPFTVRNSWFHDARQDGGIDHTDAILSNEGGPSYMVFDHNTISSVGNTQGMALQTESRGYDHVTITGNYFSGFGYTVAVGENIPCSNITFTGNTFGTDFKPGWGPLYSDTNFAVGSGNVWRNNRWRVVPGSYYTPVSDNGRYWWPDGRKAATDYPG